jgi:hypothetical protein
MESNHRKGKTEPQEDVTSRNLSEKRNGDIPIGYSGRAALRRKKYNGFVQSIASQQLCKRVPALAPRNNAVEFYVVRYTQQYECSVS